MSALLATLVGGALAIAGGLVGVYATGLGESRRWHRDAQLRVSTTLLSSLQEVMRLQIDAAYLEEKPQRGGPRGDQTSAYHKATIKWNSSIYAALLVSSPKVVELVHDMDIEVDRLLNRALEKRWSRADFRAERRALGRLAADYVNASRAEIGWSRAPIESVWAWHVKPSPSTATTSTRDGPPRPTSYDADRMTANDE